MRSALDSAGVSFLPIVRSFVLHASDLMADPPASLTSALPARYRVERELGQGGMATVWLAEDIPHGRKVAIKVVRPEVASALGGERFIQEIRVTAQLQHPNILPLHDSCQDARCLYYVMPYVEGETLRARLLREGRLPLAEAVSIAREVLDALGYAHRRGVIHRDIKPENILLSEGHALVADFGIARAMDLAGGSTLTQAGIAMGTPAYMSPEQAMAAGIDNRSDLYALGCVLFEMLGGKPPFIGDTPQKVVSAHLTQRPPDLSTIRPEVPPPLAKAVNRSLAKEPENRWPDAEAMATALVLTEPRVPPRFPARRLLRPLAAAVVAALAWVAWRGSRTPAAATSPTAVAVFPFEVRGGADLAYLAEGMVNLLSTSLNGAGELRSVDPRALIGQIHDAGTMDPSTAARVAERLGAGIYVMGSIVQGGNRVRLDAALYDRTHPEAPLGQASREGPTDSLFGLVDGIAAELLASREQGPAGRVAQIAAVTTTSLPALKAYLEGETFYRQSDYASAMDAFQRAVAADTSFALAYYRLSVTADWALRTEVARVAAEDAVKRAGRLAPHDRDLLDALLAFRRSDYRTAERLYRAIVSAYPDDVEAWFQLGELLFHAGPLEGNPIGASREAFERVLRFEPGNINARVHLAREAAADGDKPRLDSIVSRVVEAAPQGDRTVGMKVLRMYVTGTPAARAEAGTLLKSASDAVAPEAAFSPATWSAPLEGLDLLFGALTDPARNPQVRAWAEYNLGYLGIMREQLSAADAHFRAAVEVDPAVGPIHRALAATLPFVPMSPEELRTRRDEVMRWAPAQQQGSPLAMEWHTSNDSIRRHIRLYLLGMLSLRLGEPAAALEHADELARLTGGRREATVARVLSNTIRAQAALDRGDLPAGLAFIDRATTDLGYEVGLFSLFYSPARQQWLRAELLEKTGRLQDAAHWYGTFSNSAFTNRVFEIPGLRRRLALFKHLKQADSAAAAQARLDAILPSSPQADR